LDQQQGYNQLVSLKGAHQHGNTCQYASVGAPIHSHVCQNDKLSARARVLLKFNELLNFNELYCFMICIRMPRHARNDTCLSSFRYRVYLPHRYARRTGRMQQREPWCTGDADGPAG
jgi:hypothetical protein